MQLEVGAELQQRCFQRQSISRGRAIQCLPTFARMTGNKRRRTHIARRGRSMGATVRSCHAAPMQSRKQASAGSTRDAWFATVSLTPPRRAGRSLSSLSCVSARWCNGDPAQLRDSSGLATDEQAHAVGRGWRQGWLHGRVGAGAAAGDRECRVEPARIRFRPSSHCASGDVGLGTGDATAVPPNRVRGDLIDVCRLRRALDISLGPR